jgi:hypothetical protein
MLHVDCHLLRDQLLLLHHLLHLLQPLLLLLHHRLHALLLLLLQGGCLFYGLPQSLLPAGGLWQPPCFERLDSFLLVLVRSC